MAIPLQPTIRSTAYLDNKQKWVFLEYFDYFSPLWSIWNPGKSGIRTTRAKSQVGQLESVKIASESDQVHASAGRDSRPRRRQKIQG